MVNKKYSAEIIDVIGILGEKKSGWGKAILKISWNNEPPSIDIRNVNLDVLETDSPKIGKGVCLTDEQVNDLVKILLNEGYLTDIEINNILNNRNSIYKVNNKTKRKIIKVIGKRCAVSE